MRASVFIFRAQNISFVLFVAIFLFVSSGFSVTEDSSFSLNSEEQAWIKNHQVIRVGNELDWPPFDYTEDGQPMGYAIDLIDRIADKAGFEVEFVSGLTWAELLAKFKAGEIDVMPAIYESDERKVFAAFTSSYFSQPSVLVVQEGDETVESLTDLNGRRVAVIRGFMISDTLSDQFPEIKRVPVDNVVDGMMSVSMGKADAFIDSIGVVSHVSREHYIPNIRILTGVPLRAVANPDLHMAVNKGNDLLLGILEKGIGSVAEQELEILRKKWLRLPGTTHVAMSQVDERSVQRNGVSLLWWLVPLIMVAGFGLWFLSRIADRPVSESDMSGIGRFRLGMLFSKLKISAKILMILVVLSVGSVALFGYMNYREARRTLREESFKKLTAVREMKAQQIEHYFDTVAGQIVTLSESRTVIEAMSEFQAAYTELEGTLSSPPEHAPSADSDLIAYYENEFFPRLNSNAQGEMTAIQSKDFIPQSPAARYLQRRYIAENTYPTGEKHKLVDCGDGSDYSRAHQIYHPIIKSYQERFGFYDIFLVDHETGQIIYSVFKEVDFATSLLTGPYRKTNFARAFRHAKDADEGHFICLEDFDSYEPSYDAPASFIASPVFDGDEKVGVLVFQMPIDRINSLMTSNHAWEDVGLGKSGETYIVGEDYLMRNQSRFLIEDRENYLEMIRSIDLPANTIRRIDSMNTSIGLQPVDTQGTRAALDGHRNTEIFPDYRGVPVLSSYRLLDIPGVRWAIMSEIDEEEAMAAATRLHNRSLIILLFFIVAITGISFVFAKYMTRPIKMLTVKANALAEGNLGVPIEIAGGDEIAQLGRSFDVMRKALAELIGGLEQKVEERTAELGAKTEMLGTTIESLAHPFYVVNVDDYTIALKNSAAEAVGMAGASTCHALTHRSDTPCDSAEDPCPLEIVKRTGKPVVLEHVHYDKEGRPCYAEVHGYPIFDAKGKIYQMIEYSLDITARKEAERVIENQKERMQKELNVGREIQLSMVPTSFPSRPEFKVHALLEPAREVGGDFYDCFFVDEEHLCIAVGDVSDKGVASALFMAVAKTMLKSRASSDLSPASIVTHVNDELSIGNDSAMFVTLYFGILNLRTGELIATNGGHNAPLLKKCSGEIIWLDRLDGPVVGVMSGIAYKEGVVKLEAGDELLLYTDGVTEADDGQELFGNERLKNIFEKSSTTSVEGRIQDVREAVKAFEGDTPQADDITIMSLQFAGRLSDKPTAIFQSKIRNLISEIPALQDAFEEFASQWGGAIPLIPKFNMALDEMLSNAIKYAYPDDDSEHFIEVRGEVLDQSMVITLTDNGIPFNPFNREEVDTTLSIDEREIGGLGIQLVKKIFDKVAYQRRVGLNVVTVKKSF